MSIDNNIIQSLICYKKKPLVKCGEYEDNFEQCKKKLKKIRKDSKGYFDIDEYKIFYMNENDISYLIMTHSKYPQISAQQCLNSIKKDFDSSFSNINFENVGNLALQKDFGKKLKSIHEYYDKNYEDDDDNMGDIFSENQDVIGLSETLSESEQNLKKGRNETEYLTNVESGDLDIPNEKKTKKFCNKRNVIIILIVSIIVLIGITYVIIGATQNCWKFECFSWFSFKIYFKI